MVSNDDEDDLNVPGIQEDNEVASKARPEATDAMKPEYKGASVL
jgi:hypothetical protein